MIGRVNSIGILDILARRRDVGVDIVGDHGGADELAGHAEIGQRLAEQIGCRGRVGAVGYDQKLDVHAAIVTPGAGQRQ